MILYKKKIKFCSFYLDFQVSRIFILAKNTIIFPKKAKITIYWTQCLKRKAAVNKEDQCCLARNPKREQVNKALKRHFTVRLFIFPPEHLILNHATQRPFVVRFSWAPRVALLHRDMFCVRKEGEGAFVLLSGLTQRAEKETHNESLHRAQRVARNQKYALYFLLFSFSDFTLLRNCILDFVMYFWFRESIWILKPKICPLFFATRLTYNSVSFTVLFDF